MGANTNQCVLAFNEANPNIETSLIKSFLFHLAYLCFTVCFQYENVYVASVALGSNMNQCVQAFKEAEAYNGTSLIICYAPCIDWGIEMKHMMDEMKEAVDSGYWSLYR